MAVTLSHCGRHHSITSSIIMCLRAEVIPNASIALTLNVTWSGWWLSWLVCRSFSMEGHVYSCCVGGLFFKLTLCYSRQWALLFDSQLLVAISPEVWVKQTSLPSDARLIYTQSVLLLGISTQYIHHRAATFPEVSVGRGCFYYTALRAEMNGHHCHLKHGLQFKWHRNWTVT